MDYFAHRFMASRLLVASMLATLVASTGARAESVSVTVSDRDGRPVPDVVVYALPSGGESRVSANGSRAIMDQIDRKFVPHILVVQTGTAVEFPNSDTVAHHVYSFSHPNHFKLPMYKGHAHPPVTFAESGIVVLGCNIHDHMLGYIVVVDTPYFGKTDATGVAVLESPAGQATTVTIWSPRIRDDAERLSVMVDGTAADRQLAFRMEKNLRPAHESQSEVLSWSEY